MAFFEDIPKKLRFSPAQKQQLKNLGLFDEQIEALESRLPICRRTMQKDPALATLRSKITRLEKTMRRTQKEISKFLSGENTTAGCEALSRVVMADFDFHAGLSKSTDGETFDGETLKNALSALTAPLCIIERALSDLPDEQRRNRSSSFYPIENVENALLDGFIKHHDPNRTGKALPPFMDSASYAKKKRFSQVAKIFYAALGVPNKNLERPIKNYLAFKQRRDKRQRDEWKLPTLAGAKRLPKNKSGRQVIKK